MIGHVKLDIGGRMREIREQRGYSQRDLAERSGLSSNAISRIERGENSPTVSSLHQLAAALRVPIVSFFENGEQLATVLVRKNRRLRTRGEGVLIESLGSGLPGQMLEPFLIKLAPGIVCGAEPISHSGEEFVYCVEGEMEYSIETAIVLLVILPAEGMVQLSPHQHLFIGSPKQSASP
jgi:transcriptional regulator with XRE-family HTH domain